MVVVGSYSIISAALFFLKCKCKYQTQIQVARDDLNLSLQFEFEFKSCVLVSILILFSTMKDAKIQKERREGLFLG
jgi:hypothetical protein